MQIEQHRSCAVLVFVRFVPAGPPHSNSPAFWASGRISPWTLKMKLWTLHILALLDILQWFHRIHRILVLLVLVKWGSIDVRRT